ncbi:MAG: HepT-like ribonuclease domain-containing protein [Bacteroidales bacterium]
MNKDEIQKVNYLNEAIHKIFEFTSGMKSAEDLTSNIMAWDAVKMNLVVIYEMYLKLGNEFKMKYNQVDWKQVEIHKPILESPYLGFDSEEIWKAIKDKMPEFKNQIENLLKSA